MPEPQAAPRVIAGRYELEAPIGRGGFAEVWRARHLALNSYVAIKFLQGASAQDEEPHRRFTAEAQLTAQLKSQHAVQVFDFGVTDDGQPYLVMELLEGETLGRRIERLGRIGVVDTVRILGQSSRALHRAHQLGIVHRDFKPDNIVIGADDEGRDYVKVVDFGIAKLVGALEPSSRSATPDPGSMVPPTTFTKTGAILGTPFYMAPEQVRNASEVDLRADIWALGVVAFECLTGCTPFTGATLFELFQRIESGRHPDADKLEPSVPPAFNAWFDVACAPDRTKRFADAQAAWKKLMVALECGRVELEPSVRRSPASEKRQARVHGRTTTADGNARTVEVVPAGVEARQRRGSAISETLNVNGASRPPADAHAPALAPLPVRVANDPEVTAPAQPRRPRSAGALVLGLALVVLVGGIVWRVRVARLPLEAPPRGSAPTLAISAAPSDPAPAAVPSSATPITPAPAGSPPEAAIPSARASVKPQPVRVRVPVTAPRQAPSPVKTEPAAPTSSPPPSAQPSTVPAASVDPSSYR